MEYHKVKAAISLKAIGEKVMLNEKDQVLISDLPDTYKRFIKKV